MKDTLEVSLSLLDQMKESSFDPVKVRERGGGERGGEEGKKGEVRRERRGEVRRERI